MNSREFLPAEPLRKHVRCFRILEGEGASSPAGFQIIAAGRPGLIFQQDPSAFLGADGGPFPRIFLHGQATRHSRKVAVKSFRNIQVDFHPHALYSVFGLDADALTDGHVDLEALPGSGPAENLLNAESDEKKIGILSEFLAGRIRANGRPEAPMLRSALERLLKPGSHASLAGLRSELKISERALERLFRRQVGISPRLFARVARFQAALRRAENPGRSTLTEIAFRYGYADASHCIREFKEFAGAGPGRFRLLAPGQVENFPEWEP